MKKDYNDGGPISVSTKDHSGHRIVMPEYASSMTLLDYFAGRALAALGANPAYGHILWDDAARSAYQGAAAMLAERKRRMEAGNES
jgi:hypothetical protein